jgi:hypothetical protein
MKNLLLFFFLLATNVYAQQTIIMGQASSVSTCNALFYDSGGPLNNYSENQNQTITIFPAAAGNFIEVAFSTFNIQFDDFMLIYDGPNTLSPLIPSGMPQNFYAPANSYQNFSPPGTIISTHPSGALTFVFNSSLFNTSSGWAASVSCISPTSLPNCATNTLPANGSVSQSELSSLSWNPGTGLPPTGYDVYFGTNSNPPLVSINQLSTTYNPGTLLINTTYYYKIVPRNANGQAAGCTINSFTTASTASIIMSNSQVTACDAWFYDSGGPTGNFDDVENYTITISPSTPGSIIQVNFSSFNIDGADFLNIYNGTSAAAPFVGSFGYWNPPGIISANNSSGALTFEFVASGSGFTSSGWEAFVTCISGASLDLAGPSNAIQGDGIPIDFANPFGSNTFFNFYYSSNGGQSFSFFDSYEAVAGPNTYVWVPIPPSGNVLLMIQPQGNPLFSDTIAVTVAPVLLGITSPVGGAEILFDYNEILINWTSSQPINQLFFNYVALEFRPSGTSQWQPLNYYSSGAVGTSVTYPAWYTNFTVGETYDLRVYPEYGTGFTALNAFTLKDAIILSPNGGEVLTTGSTVNITAESYNYQDATLQFSSNNGSTWTTLSSSFIIDPGINPVSSYSWTVPSISSTNCLVRLVSNSNPNQVVDQCNATFTIQCNIAVPTISANGPTSFCSGGSVALSIPTQTGVTYQWKLNGNNVGTNSNTYTANQAGTYTIQLTNSCGTVTSSNSITVTINQAPVAATISANGPTSFCSGGSVALSIPTQTGVTYQWKLNGNNVGSNSNTYSANQAGTYTIDLTNSCGTVASSNSITVTINQAPVAATISANGPTSFCSGGSVALSIPTQTGVTYQWKLNGNNVGSNSNTYSANQAGTYTIDLTNSCGTVASSNSITVTINQAPVAATISANGPTSFCSGGSVALSIPTQTGVTYQWKLNGNNVGTNSNTYTANQAGTYTIQLTNSCGTVTSSNSISVTINQAPTATTISTNGPTTFCSGGSVALSIPTQTGVTYQWKLNGSNVGTNSNTYTANQAGTYTIDLTNSCGTVASSNSITVTINQAPMAATISANGPTSFCSGGSVALSIPTQTGVTYQWKLNGNNVGTNSNTYTANQAGTYTIDLINSCGTVAGNNSIDVVVFSNPITPTISAATTIICSGQSVMIQNPATAANYLWSNNETTQNITVTTPGDYSVIITDANGCVSSSSNVVTITTINPPTSPVLVSANAICSGNFATIEVSSPVSVNWFTSAIGGTPIGSGTIFTTGILSSAISFYAESNNNGCSSTNRLEVNVIVNPNPIISIDSITQAGCNNAQNGGAYISVSQGLPPYTYLWNNGSTNSNLTGVNAGVYSLNVTDGNGCIAVQNNINISSTSSISATAQITDVQCPGGLSGMINLSVSGGTPPFSFDWNNGQSDSLIVYLSGGDYYATITDAANCVSVQGPYFVYEPDILQLDFNITDQTTGNLGQINLTVSGGTAPYNFLWDNGETTQNLIDLVAGIYTIMVTDNNSCVVTDSATINLITYLLNNHQISVAIYPNPVSDLLTIELPETGIYQVLIFDLQGRVLINQEGMKNKVVLNIGEWPTSTYLMKVTDVSTGIGYKHKIIKQ